MAFIANFTATQYISVPNLIVFDDTSTGTDAAITTRKVYLQKSDGTYLVTSGTTTDYMLWPKSSGNTISYDVLDKDYALTITVEWVSATSTIGDYVVLYSKTVDYCFSTYEKD